MNDYIPHTQWDIVTNSSPDISWTLLINEAHCIIILDTAGSFNAIIVNYRYIPSKRARNSEFWSFPDVILTNYSTNSRVVVDLRLHDLHWRHCNVGSGIIGSGVTRKLVCISAGLSFAVSNSYYFVLFTWSRNREPPAMLDIEPSVGCVWCTNRF